MKCLVVIISLLFARIIYGQTCEVNNTSFQYNEVIDYTIYYHLAGFWISAGKVSFKVDSTSIDNEPHYHLNSYGTTLKKYDWIYKVRDYYESYVSEEKMQPTRFKREVNEGNTFIREEYTFDFDNKAAITTRKMEKEGIYIQDTVSLGRCSYDVISMIYIARNLDYSNLKEGDKLPIHLFIDNEDHSSYIEYLGKENVKLGSLGTFRCIKFSPLLIEGTIFNAGDEMIVYVTDDENKVPLLIETPILVGSIRAKVAKLSGLRYPLRSKL